jgi:hypothetical protein
LFLFDGSCGQVTRRAARPFSPVLQRFKTPRLFYSGICNKKRSKIIERKEKKMKKMVAGVVLLAVALCVCQTNRPNGGIYTRQQEACARGDAESCAILGDGYERGKAGAYDYAKAVEFYEKSCALKNYAACANAARIHSFFKESVIKMRAYARKACDANIASGCAHLVSAYLYGAERDVAKALALAEKSCNENDGYACGWLGHIYKSEEDVNSDLATANRFLPERRSFINRNAIKVI